MNRIYGLSVLAMVLLAVGFSGCGKDESGPTESQAPPKTDQPASGGAGEQAQAQTVCPIMNQPIDKQYFVDYEGQRVYFCCLGCETKFKEEPEKYLQQIAAAGVTLEKSPVKTN